MLAKNRKHYIDNQLKERDHNNFERKAWMQSDKKNINARVWACPKGDLFLNAMQLPVYGFIILRTKATVPTWPCRPDH